jgi:hypothetical protein
MAGRLELAVSMENTSFGSAEVPTLGEDWIKVCCAAGTAFIKKKFDSAPYGFIPINCTDGVEVPGGVEFPTL